MDAGDALSGGGFGVAAVLLALSGVRALARRQRSDAREPELQAFARFGMALGCAALAASFLIAASRTVSGILLGVAVVALLGSALLENRRIRRLQDD